VTIVEFKRKKEELAITLGLKGIIQAVAIVI
jgi:hypothetical protein